MSYYDPHRVFNHKRTAEQRKGQSIQNRLIDPVEPRVDPEVLRKAKRLCEVYNLIPQPRLPLQIKLTEVTIEENMNIVDWVHNYLNSINAPNSKYLINMFSTTGFPVDHSLPYDYNLNGLGLSYMIIQHNSSATTDTGVEAGAYKMYLKNGTYTSTSVISAEVLGDYTSYVSSIKMHANSINKNMNQASSSSASSFTVLIFEIIE